MTVYSAQKIIDAARAQSAAFNRQLEELEGLADQQRRDLAALHRELDAAWEHLATELVPALDAPPLDAAASRLALRSISAAHVGAEIEAERREFAAEAERIDADPEYVQREGILNELAIRLAELDDLIRPLAEVRSTCEAQPLWGELIEFGYDTPAYAGKWWTLSYYNHWKHGDLALAALQPRFPDAKRFADVRAKAEEYHRAEAELARERSELAERQRRIEGLVARRAWLDQRSESAPQRFLALVRGRVRAHLSALEPADVGPLLESSPGAALGYKRVLGIAAKQRYLTELGKQLVDEPRAQIQRVLAKNKREIAKKSRPKHYHAHHQVADFDKRFGVRQDAWTKRRERYDRTRHQIVEFHDYGRADFARDFLWWDVMTDGKLDGDFIHEVATHRAFYGDRARRDDDDAHGAAVAAVAGHGASGLDDGLMHDGS